MNLLSIVESEFTDNSLHYHDDGSHWDNTGADSSAISKKAAAELGLIPISWATVQTAGGECLVPIYAVDVMLPNNILIKGVKVTQADLKICDALIGMDIITLGDFLIANNGNTRFSFRIPAEGCPTLSSTSRGGSTNL